MDNTRLLVTLRVACRVCIYTLPLFSSTLRRSGGLGATRDGLTHEVTFARGDLPRHGMGLITSRHGVAPFSRQFRHWCRLRFVKTCFVTPAPVLSSPILYYREGSSDEH